MSENKKYNFGGFPPILYCKKNCNYKKNQHNNVNIQKLFNAEKKPLINNNKNIDKLEIKKKL
jgi:hypothetical protein